MECGCLDILDLFSDVFAVSPVQTFKTRSAVAMASMMLKMFLGNHFTTCAYSANP